MIVHLRIYPKPLIVKQNKTHTQIGYMSRGLLGWLLVQKTWGNGVKSGVFVTATFQFWLLSCDEHTATQDANNCEIGVQGL